MDNPVANLNVYQVIATDKDPGPGNKLSYKIVDGNNDNAFTIEEFTGKFCYYLAFKSVDHGVG